MKRYFLYMAIALAGLGCQRYHEEPQITIPAGKGAVQVALKINATTADAVSKATVTDPYLMTAEGLTASILQGDQVLQTWEPMSAMPPVLYLKPGSYTLDVETRGARAKINATPYYVGQTNFEIVAGWVSSIEATATLCSMVVSLSLADGIAPLAGYKINYYAIDRPTNSLFEVTQAQNSPTAKRVYMDEPFAYGVRVEGRLNELPWRKNILVYNHLTVGVYHNLILSDQ